MDSATKAYVAKHGHGLVVQPDSMGRCGCCGYANFNYSNGFEFSASGVRGYRCVNCDNIKDENWRKGIASQV